MKPRRRPRLLALLFAICLAPCTHAQEVPADRAFAPTPTNLLELLADNGEAEVNFQMWTIRGSGPGPGNDDGYSHCRIRSEQGGLVCIFNRGTDYSKGFNSLSRMVFSPQGKLVSFEQQNRAGDDYTRRMTGAWEGDEFVVSRIVAKAEPDGPGTAIVKKVWANDLASMLHRDLMPLVIAYHLRQGSTAYAYREAALMPRTGPTITRVQDLGFKTLTFNDKAFSGQMLSVDHVETDETAKATGRHDRYKILVDKTGKTLLAIIPMRCGASYVRGATREEVAEVFGLKDIEAMEKQEAGDQLAGD